MVAANSQWLVQTICCTCNGNNPTDPSHVRNQTGSFGDAFARLIRKKALTMDKEQSFRDALTDAATLSGWSLGNSE